MALSNDFNMAYDQFVSAWLDYERVRSTGDFSEMVSRKSHVDDLRLRMRSFFATRV